MIRAATAADLHAIADLQIASWRAAYRGMLDDAYLDGPMQDLRDSWAEIGAGRFILVEENGGTLRGFGAVRMDNRQGPYLDNLHVDPQLRRSGVGGRLLSACKAAVREQGGGSLWLGVMADNGPARRFYASQGGQEIASFSEDFQGRQVAMIRVEWRKL